MFSYTIGFLLDILHSIWPETIYLVVQVGKTVWPDQLEDKKHVLYVGKNQLIMI